MITLFPARFKVIFYKTRRPAKDESLVRFYLESGHI